MNRYNYEGYGNYGNHRRHNGFNNSRSKADEAFLKPYYYMRNGLLHIRYNVDRCIRLSEAEEQKIKEQFSKRPHAKQEILSDNWQLLVDFVGKEVIEDGIKEAAEVTRQKSMGYTDGYEDN